MDEQLQHLFGRRPPSADAREDTIKEQVRKALPTLVHLRKDGWTDSDLAAYLTDKWMPIKAATL